MMKPRLMALSSLVAAACASAPPASEPTPVAPGLAPSDDPNAALTGQEWRKERPASGPEAELLLPTFERASLDNGLTVLVAKERSLPLVAFVLVTRGGGSTDPKGKAGLTTLAYQMLGEGAGPRDALQFSDAVADLGASFGSSADQDAGVVSISGLSRNRDALLDLLADAVLRPRLAQRDFDRIKTQSLANIQRRRGAPQGLAFEYVPAMIYGEQHPYGHPVGGTEGSVGRITSSDVKKHLSETLVPASTALIAVGDIDLEEAKAAAQRVFGKWRGRKRTDPVPPAVAPKARQLIKIVHKDNSPQTMLIVGRPIFGRGHEDEIPATVANEILGGTFTSRLNMNLREDKGYTYGASTGLSARRGVGAFLGYTLVRLDATGASLKETLDELGRMQTLPPTAEEVARAKAGIIRSLPGQFETTASAASASGEIFVYELPLDHHRTRPDRIQAVDEAAVLEVAKRYFTEPSMQILLVGESKEIEAQLNALGLGKTEIIHP